MVGLRLTWGGFIPLTEWYSMSKKNFMSGKDPLRRFINYGKNFTKELEILYSSKNRTLKYF